MGLLSNFIEAGLDGKGYYRRRREDQQAAEAEGLMQRLYGSAGTPVSQTAGGIMPTTETTANGVTTITGGEQMQGQMQPGTMQGASGLLGGQITPPQYNAQLDAGLAGIYGAEGMLQDRSRQRIANQGAMQRQQQQQQFYGQNVSAYQGAQLQAQRTQNSIANSNAQWDDKRAMMGDYNKQAAAPIAALEHFETTQDMVVQQGGLERLNPYQQLTMITNYMKMQKPGEALMQDDMENMMNASGIPGLTAMYKNLVSGKGVLGVPQLKQMFGAMAGMKETRQKQLGRVNTQYDRLAQGRGISPDYKRDAAQFEQIPKGMLGGKQAMPDDVIQID